MADSIKRHELPRLSARWPITIQMESGETTEETRNFTVEGVFLHCLERLREGGVSPMTIKFPEKPVEVTGKLLWSNLDSFTPLSYNPSMGFCFMKIDGKDRQRLGEAIAAQSEKLGGLRREASPHAQSRSSGEVQGLVMKDAADEEIF